MIVHVCAGCRKEMSSLITSCLKELRSFHPLLTCRTSCVPSKCANGGGVGKTGRNLGGTL